MFCYALSNFVLKSAKKKKIEMNNKINCILETDYHTRIYFIIVKGVHDLFTAYSHSLKYRIVLQYFKVMTHLCFPVILIYL